MADSHSHSPLAHHFEDLPQQRAAAELGMWLFLVTEVMFFGGLFTAYVLYRHAYEADFAEAVGRHMNVVLGAVNTAVLLCSSLSMALAVHAAETSQRQKLKILLAVTIVLGSVFLGIKFYEYYHKYEEGLIPFRGFHFREDLPVHARMFFNLYFLMTGVHAFHMIIGLGVLGTLLGMALGGGLTGPRSTPVHLTGLYWHFVDIIWVFLFPFLYLIGAR